MSVKRRKISKEVKQLVWDKKQGLCYYCGKVLLPIGEGQGEPDAFSIEHDIALCLGGSDELWNLFPCCNKCNNDRSKDPVLPEQYRSEPLTHNPFTRLEGLIESPGES